MANISKCSLVTEDRILKDKPIFRRNYVKNKLFTIKHENKLSLRM